jgi:hypothetical protein
MLSGLGRKLERALAVRNISSKAATNAVGLLLLLLAFSYVVLRGTFAAGAKDIDARYFFVAGKVWLSGHSPYDFEHYGRVWLQYFEEPTTPGSFAYLPGSILYSAPLGIVDWPTGASVLRALNLSAVLVTVLLGLSYVRRWAGQSLSLVHFGWLAFGMAIGGVPGTILTGQSTVIVCAAAFAVAALPSRLWPLLLPALIVASSKPQIAGPVLLVVTLCDHAMRRRIIGAGVLALLCCLAVLMLDSAPVTHLVQTLSGNAGLGPNSPGRMIGLGPLLWGLSVGGMVAKVLPWLALAGAVLLIVYHAPKFSTAERRVAPMPLIAGFLLTGLAYPYHGYDTAMFAPVCALCGLLPLRRQLVFFPALAVIGRPQLVSWLVVRAENHEVASNQLVTVFWLSLLVAAIYWCVRDARQSSAEPLVATHPPV